MLTPAAVDAKIRQALVADPRLTVSELAERAAWSATPPRPGWSGCTARASSAATISEAVARGVAHLWAYKDEYEVARLLTRPELLDHVQAQVPGATKVTYNLHPPALRSMGAAPPVTPSVAHTFARSSASCSPRTWHWSSG